MQKGEVPEGDWLNYQQPRVATIITCNPWSATCKYQQSNSAKKYARQDNFIQTVSDQSFYIAQCSPFYTYRTVFWFLFIDKLGCFKESCYLHVCIQVNLFIGADSKVLTLSCHFLMLEIENWGKRWVRAPNPECQIVKHITPNYYQCLFTWIILSPPLCSIQ